MSSPHRPDPQSRPEEPLALPALPISFRVPQPLLSLESRYAQQRSSHHNLNLSTNHSPNPPANGQSTRNNVQEIHLPNLQYALYPLPLILSISSPTTDPPFSKIRQNNLVGLRLPRPQRHGPASKGLVVHVCADGREGRRAVSAYGGEGGLVG